jgi:hypothetical protein
MDLVQLFIQIQGSTSSTDFREIDLYPEEPITYTKRIAYLEDPTVVASDFARTFRVPNTANNSVIFKAAFNVNSADYDPTLYCNAYLNVNGIYFSSGNLRLENVYRNDAVGLIEYEINYYGQTTTFAANVKSKLMKELDLSEYNHVVTYANLVMSWNQTFFNGDIVYPLAEWGYDYSDNPSIPIQSTLSVYDASYSQKGFTDPSNPLRLKQWKPSIRAKYLWDKIFSEAGFTYTSTFLNNQEFTNIYHLSTGDNTSDAEIKVDEFKVTAQAPALTFGPNDNYFEMTTPATFEKIIFGTIIFDYGSAISITQSHFTCPFSGPYTFQILDSDGRITPGIDNPTCPAGPQSGNFNFAIYRNGVFETLQTAFFDSPTGGFFPLYSDVTMTSTTIIFPTINLVAGDKIDVRLLTYFVPAQTCYFNVNIAFLTNSYFSFNKFNFYCNYEDINPQVLIGYFEPNYRQIEFIKGINDRFKLVWEPDPLNETNFLIEPWVNWISNGATYSWSDKLDENKDIQISPLFNDFTRDIKFKDFEEQDFVNFSFYQGLKQTFGQLNLYSDIQTISGETIYEQFYSCTPLQSIPGCSPSQIFLVPHFAKDTETERSPITVKPRLLYYNGLIDVPNFTGSTAIGATGAYYLNDGISQILTMDKYPLMSQFDQLPFDGQVLDMNFNNSQQFFAGITGIGYGSGRTENTIYTKYWKKWVDTTYLVYSKKMTATFNLGYSDVIDLKFNDKIWIKDSWWFPTVIKDYKLGSRQNTTVELVKMYGIDLNLSGNIQYVGGYPYEGICAGSTPCLACCCVSPGYTLYGTTSSFTQSLALYSDPILTNYAVPGYYKYSGSGYQIGPLGSISATFSCGACSCTGNLTKFFTCMQSTICFACCCTSFSTEVYGNGATIDTSSQIWADALGTIPATPNTWYFQSGNTSASFVGADGFTVTMYGPCTCNCGGGGGNQLVLETYNMSYDTGSFPALGAKVACCVGSYGLTQSRGLVSLYGNTASFTASNSFYFDLFKDYPVGTASTGPLVLSDGEFYKVVTGGTAGSLNSCDYSSNCPDRTEVVTFNVSSSIGTDVTVEVDAQISFDQVLNWWTYGSTSSGFTFSNTFTASYEPNSFIHCDIITGTAIGYLTIDRYIDSSLDNTQTYTTPGSISSEYFRVGTQSTMVNITWADTI